MSIFWATLIFPINDVTTSPDRPPAFVQVLKLDANRGRDMAYPEKFVKRQKDYYPDLAPWRSPVNAQKTFQNAVTVAKSRPGWTILDADEANYRIEAVATTPLLKFSDDIVIEVRPEASGSSVHVRSKSRLGRNDFGANHRRIVEFLKALSAI